MLLLRALFRDLILKSALEGWRLLLLIFIVSQLKQDSIGAKCWEIFKPPRFFGPINSVYPQWSYYEEVAANVVKYPRRSPIECASLCIAFGWCTGLNYVVEQECQLLNTSQWDPMKVVVGAVAFGKRFPMTEVVDGPSFFTAIPAAVSSNYQEMSNSPVWPTDCNGQTTYSGFLVGMRNGKQASNDLYQKGIDHIKCRVFPYAFVLDRQDTRIVQLSSSTGNATCPNGYVITAVAYAGSAFMHIEYIRCNRLLPPWTVDNSHCFSQSHAGVNPNPLSDVGLLQPVDRTWTAECGSRTNPHVITQLNKRWVDGSISPAWFVQSGMTCCSIEELP